MHEICHLQHHNRSPRFYRLLTRCQTDWHSHKDTLDQFKLH
jgi:predicted metal-dependent hydrolase